MEDQLFEEQVGEEIPEIPRRMTEFKEILDQRLKGEPDKQEKEEKIENKEKEKKEEEKEKNEENEKVPQFQDLFKIIKGNAQIQEKSYPEGEEFNSIQCFFKKIKLSNNSNSIENFNESYGICFCNKINDFTKSKCEPKNEMCPNCMKNTQKKYGLKPHYLINSKGRVCTYKRGKMYCKGKFRKLELDNGQNKGIKYSYNYVCGHSGQCDSCKSLTKLMDKYFGGELMKKLIERDKNMN